MERLTKFDNDELLVREEERILNSNGYITKDEMYKIMRHLAEKLAEYEQLEEQGLLLRLPCKVGDIVYHLEYRYTKCSKYQQEMDEYNCQGCDLEGCDSKKEWYINPIKPGLSSIVEFMLTEELREKYKYYLTREEAEEALKKL